LRYIVYSLTKKINNETISERRYVFMPREKSTKDLPRGVNDLPELITFWPWGMVKNDVIWEMSDYNLY
jgi:hypothetical protein